MSTTKIQLDPDPKNALAAVREASRERPVLVFKQSPICPVSHRAESELVRWVESLGEQASLGLALVDVIAERGLARGLTAELDLQHESPQGLWFQGGELTWHGSHGELTGARFGELLRGD